MLTVLLASDLQIGKPFRPVAAEAILTLAQELGPDLSVVSGDLTQRAKPSEYRQARALLGRFPGGMPVVTPGNHDVPVFRVWERALMPYRNWRRFIRPTLDACSAVPGATVVALNSSAPRRAIVNGRLDSHQIEFARRSFAAAPAGDLKILVVHHHFVPTPDGDGGPPMPKAARHLAAFESMGVDLVVGGHVHQMHLTRSRDVVQGREGDPGIPLVACGTSASRRGRGVEKGRNSLAVIRIGEDSLEVTPHFFDEQSQRFEAVDAVRLERHR